MKLFMMILFLTTLAYADSNSCDHNLTLGNATIQIQNTYQVIAQPYTIRRTHPSNGRCSRYRLYFSKGIANSYNREAKNSANHRADYNLHQNFLLLGTLKDYNDADSGLEYVQGNTPDENVTYSGVFYISVPGFLNQGTLPGGTYTDNIQIRVYSIHTNGDRELEEVQPFSVNLIVSTSLSVSIVDEGGAHNEASTSKLLNFGTLATNQELGADVRVSSNTSYQLRVSSLNNGTLKRGTSSLAYQLRVNGALHSLSGSASSPVTVATGAANGSSPARYNLRVKITGATTNLPAGEYGDTITITAIAN